MRNLATLFAKNDSLRFGAGSKIIDITKEKQKVFFVKEGYIAVYQISNNKRKMLSILDPGNIFPLVPYILGGNKQAYMQAIIDVELQSIDKEIFFKSVDSNKELLKELVNMISNYLLIYFERVENLEMETTEKRVIGRLLQFKSRFGKEINGNTIIQLPMTHEMLAESINVARENVTRILNKLQKERLITNKKGTITLLNEKKLQEYLH